jgi:predicted Zn-dependent protease
VRNGETIGRLKDAMVTGNLYKLLKDSVIDLTMEQETVDGSAVFPYVGLKDVTITS